MKKIIKAAAVLLSCGLCMLSGCSTPSYDGYQAPAASPSQLKPITNGGYRIERSYDNVEPTKEKTIKAVTSSDGMCSIIKKASYYEVTLDYENGSHKTNGAAYAETILKIYPDYPKKIDGYIFEMIEKLIPENDKDKKKKYDLLDTGLYALKDSLDDDYREELEAYAEKISGGVRGIAKDGKLSYEEAIMMNMVPDLLRGTACSAITANGKKTETAHRLAARLLEWDPGSKKQLSEFHCLVHFKNGERSFTSVSLLGMFDILTAVNDDGVMLAELDVGSKHNTAFTVEGKTCFSYDIRRAAENCTTAKEAADYYAGRTNLYTYNVNLYVTDDKDAFAVEAVVGDKDGKTVIRDANTALHDKLTWSDKDIFCIVNSFVTKGNSDKITEEPSNIVRWRKYEQLFTTEKEKLSLNHFKELLTSEKIIDSPLINFRSPNLIHMVVVDFDTHRMQAVFCGKELTDDPVWIDLGKVY